MTASISILSIPDELRKRNVQSDGEQKFSIRWASNLVRYFETEPAVRSVTYPAILHIAGYGMVDGSVEIHRDGFFAIHTTR